MPDVIPKSLLDCDFKERAVMLGGVVVLWMMTEFREIPIGFDSYRWAMFLCPALLSPLSCRHLRETVAFDVLVCL